MTNLDFVKQTKMKLFGYAIGDIIRATRGGSLMGAFVQSFCFVGYLAEIANLVKADKKSKDNVIYENFIEKYLPKYDAKKIYAIRCALVHTYGYSNSMNGSKLEGYSFTHKNPERHGLCVDNIYHLNLSNFIFDIIKSSYCFFNELEQKSEDELFDYIQRIKAMLTVNNGPNVIIPENYGLIDTVLSPMDSIDIDWRLLENNIYQLCLNS